MIASSLNHVVEQPKHRAFYSTPSGFTLSRLGHARRGSKLVEVVQFREPSGFRFYRLLKRTARTRQEFEDCSDKSWIVRIIRNNGT